MKNDHKHSEQNISINDHQINCGRMRFKKQLDIDSPIVVDVHTHTHTHDKLHYNQRINTCAIWKTYRNSTIWKVFFIV